MLNVAQQRTLAVGVRSALDTLELRTMVIGQLGSHLRFRTMKQTKDVDLCPVPAPGTGPDFDAMLTGLQTYAHDHRGHARLELGGQTITVWLPIGGADAPVEIILGGDSWLSPDVLADAASSAAEIDGFLVPSAEHLLCMKLHKAVNGEKKAYEVHLKAVEDAVDMLDAGLRAGIDFDADEMERLIAMRPPEVHRSLSILWAGLMDAVASEA